MAVAWLLVSLAAAANDTDISYGGSPRALSGHPTVAMHSEVVKVTVSRKSGVTVDCRFVFVNSGPACRVRMGFPDAGPAAYEEDPNSKPVGQFTLFKSWVNGRQVSTHVARGGEGEGVWHVKEVAFPAGKTVEVRDLYTAPVGSSVGYDHFSVAEADYVLHTGASWHGNIGRSEVDVKMDPALAKAPLKLRPLYPGREHAIGRYDRHTIYYRGPCKPVVSGQSLKFVRTNWRPTDDDDIYLVFDIRRLNTSGSR